jgi:AcrR family transcriptional regulator
LRERKRRRTRAAIADAAWELFRARGFEQVTVAEIAAAAEVAEKTVYNYFPVKAALVFDAGDELLQELLDAVRERGTGTPVVAAIRTFIDRRAARAERQSPPRPTPSFLQLIEASPTLQAYRREMFARWETALAQLLAQDTAAPAGAAEPFVAAAAIVAVLRAGFEAQTRGAALAEHNSLSALDLLTRGLASYAPAPPPSPCGGSEPIDRPPTHRRSSGPAV